MKRIHTLAVIAGLLAAGACNRGAAHDADRAADKAQKEMDKVHNAQQDLANDGLDHSKKLADKASDYAAAQSDFEQKRQIRVEVLHSEHALIASQPVLVSALANLAPLTDAGRADVNEKLQILMMRLDETGNAITALQSVDAASWQDRDNEASRAMSRLADARDAAFEALRKAPRTERSA